MQYDICIHARVLYFVLYNLVLVHYKYNVQQNILRHTVASFIIILSGTSCVLDLMMLHHGLYYW